MAHSHDSGTKAAVLAAIMAGQAVAEVARQFSVDRTTIFRWRASAGLSDATPLQRKKWDEIGELLFDYLRENLTTLSVQADHFRDRDWLKTQPAGEVANLHGVLVDKAVRILTALEPNDREESSEEPSNA